MRNVGNVNRQLLFDDASGIAHARLGMAFGKVHPLYDGPQFSRKHAQHLARLPLVAPGDDHDVVPLFDF